MTHSMQPSIFISHGAPTFALEPGIEGVALGQLGARLPRPRAILIVSPHWMTPTLAVATTAKPQTIHDFNGFPAQLYALQYPASGAPEVALEVLAELAAAGWPARADASWGLDHGAWVPMMHMYPEADVPIMQVSMPHDLSPQAAFELGRALRPLRSRGVMIIGSGSLTHNLRDLRPPDSSAARYATEFVEWVRGVVSSGALETLTETFQNAPHAQAAHPTDEHYLPLLIAAGAAEGAPRVTILQGGIRFGVLSMESYVFEG